jgi:hypothetical protein
MRTLRYSIGCLSLALHTACAASGAMAPEAPPQPVSADYGGAAGEAKAEESDKRLAMAEPPAPAAAPSRPGGAPAPAQPAKPQSSGAPAASDASAVAVRAPMLIYTANITMAVFEVNASLGRVEAIGKELGGFLAKRDDTSVTIRVPAAAFEEAVKRIEGVGDMLHRNVQAEDVTEEFRDLEIRLKSARAVQQRLSELLAKAVKVEESIAIERELDRVSGEIERVEGRMKYLRDRAAFSTITVRFEPKAKEQVGAREVRLPVRWLYDLGLKRLLSL